MNANKVYLSNTDTTVGFLSSNDKKLSAIKNRKETQKILEILENNKKLISQTRIPHKLKNMVRRAKRTTFIYPNNCSYRVVSNTSEHHGFIKKVKKIYSTSANITKEKFDLNYACNTVDIIIYDKNEFIEKNPSSIYKITNYKIRKIR